MNKSIWDSFIAYVKSKNKTTHAFGAFIVSAAFAYTTSPALRDYIGTLLVGYPVIVTKIGVLAIDISAGVTLWRNYSHSSSPAGTLATAREIKSRPDAPTAAQVDAATTK